MAQQVSTLASASGAGSNSELRTSASPRSPASMMAQEWWADQPAQHGIGVLGVAQVPGAIELVQAGGGEAGCVADVVQPGGGFEQIGVRAENRCQAACPGGGALDLRPAAGKRLLQECPGQRFGPGS
jgi:hypothetical protein